MPRSSVRLERVWLEAGPAGSRIELAPASEPYAVAEAVSAMVAKVRGTDARHGGAHRENQSPTAGDCSCGACSVACEFRAARARRKAIAQGAAKAGDDTSETAGFQVPAGGGNVDLPGKQRAAKVLPRTPVLLGAALAEHVNEAKELQHGA